MMLAFLAIPLVRKIGLWVVIALGSLWLLRWYSNKAYNAGYDKGKVQGSEDMLKAHQVEWEAAQKQLDEELATVSAKQQQLATDKVLVSQNRKVIVDTLTSGQQQFMNRLAMLTPQIAALPPSEVDGWIRKALNELRQ
jgi:hypothetical protein